MRKPIKLDPAAPFPEFSMRELVRAQEQGLQSSDLDQKPQPKGRRSAHEPSKEREKETQ